MNAPESDRYGASSSESREIARGLRDALAPALAADATRFAHAAARGVAELLDLNGLGRVLAVCERHAGATPPADVRHVLDRVRRVVEACGDADDVSPFQEADAQFGLLAEELESLAWHEHEPGSSRPAIATLTAADALADVRLRGIEAPERVRLTAAAGTALRAACEWLGLDDGRTVHVTRSDAALELSFEPGEPGGLGPAGELLAAAGGSLGRALHGRWSMRVPVLAPRPTFLMLEQGTHRFALPWSAIVRLKLLPGDARTIDHPVLAPLAPGDGAGERPAALVALGLRRAWFVADRVVWRLTASPADDEGAPPVAGVSHAVRTDDGHAYWVLDAEWLLRDVDPIETPAPVARAARPRVASEIAPPTSAPAPIDPWSRVRVEVVGVDAQPTPLEKPAAEPVADGSTARAEEAAEAEPVFELLPSDLTPLDDDAPSPVTAERPELTPSPAVTESPASAPPPSSVPVAQDSESPAVAAEEAAAAPERAVEAAAAPPRELDVMWVAPIEAVAPPAIRSNAEAEPTAPARPPLARALIAEDSLVARVFLQRLLEQRGFEVEAVETAAAMWSRLEAAHYAFVGVDVHLPDAGGLEFMRALASARWSHASPFALAVLTRDAEDERVARLGGLDVFLRKPFEAPVVDRLLKPFLPAGSADV